MSRKTWLILALGATAAVVTVAVVVLLASSVGSLSGTTLGRADFATESEAGRKTDRDVAAHQAFAWKGETGDEHRRSGGLG